MGQINFRMGVPRAGSAASNAEQEERAMPELGRVPLPRSGSAARASEEEKAANGPALRPQAGFSLRGQNGVVTRNVPVTSTRFNSAGEHVTPPGVSVPHAAPAPRSASAQPLVTRRGDVLAQIPAGPLQIAASRFQALVRSLFTSGERSGKS